MAEAIKQPTTTNTLTAFQRARASAWGRWSTRLIFYALLVAAWQLLFNSGIWQDFILPSPLEVLNSLVPAFQSGLFLQSILASLGRLALGYAISLGVGLVLGLLIGRVNLLKETVGSLVLGLQSLPSICWLPLAVLWFGLNDRAIIFVVVMGALFSITLGVESGVRATPPIYLKPAPNLGTRGIALYTQVGFPPAFPTILNCFNHGLSFSLLSPL